MSRPIHAVSNAATISAPRPTAAPNAARLRRSSPSDKRLIAPSEHPAKLHPRLIRSELQVSYSACYTHRFRCAGPAGLIGLAKEVLWTSQSSVAVMSALLPARVWPRLVTPCAA